MTNEEALRMAYSKRKDSAGEERDFLNTIIQALEQDTVPFDFDLYQAGLMDMPKEMIEVLDKIRAEIEEIELNLTYEENYKVGGSWGLRKALDIIDKYKAESDGKE